MPLDHATGDRFRYDPVLPLFPWSVLDPTRTLAAAGPEGDTMRFALVDARRARNRMQHALKAAARALGA